MRQRNHLNHSESRSASVAKGVKGTDSKGVRKQKLVLVVSAVSRASRKGCAINRAGLGAQECESIECTLMAFLQRSPGTNFCMEPEFIYFWSQNLNHAAQFSSVQFSRSVVSDSLRPHEPQHAKPPCPSPTPGVHPNPCPWSQ